jgi:hypothetical protein
MIIMVEDPPRSDKQPAEIIVRNLLDQKSFPDDVTQEALDYLEKEMPAKAYKLLLKNYIQRVREP